MNSMLKLFRAEIKYLALNFASCCDSFMMPIRSQQEPHHLSYDSCSNYDSLRAVILKPVTHQQFSTMY